MKSVLALALTIFAAVAIAAPLNINLGAYSPALVVGDGAIGFRGARGRRLRRVLLWRKGEASYPNRWGRYCTMPPGDSPGPLQGKGELESKHGSIWSTYAASPWLASPMRPAYEDLVSG